MKRRTLLAALGSASVGVLGATAGPGSDGLIGVWRLVSCERELDNGRIDKPLGEQPVGRLIYDEEKRVSVQMMRPGRHLESAKAARTSWEAAQIANCGEIREMVAGYLAYFGTYEVDESTKTISHTVTGSLVPGWVGTVRKRNYDLTGDSLKMTLRRGAEIERIAWKRDSG